VTNLEDATEFNKVSDNSNVERTSSGASNEVHKKDIEKVVASWTGIPVTKLTEDEGKKLLQLEDRIHQRLIDQMEAVMAVSEAVRRGRIGLASGARPIASFIFLGPSGTGKTELAKTLSEILFGRDDAIIRLDMSEYMEKHEVAKLIGAPPGYVGYEEGGQLTEAVRAKPYSIVLLDEVEKAHPDVFNILLQLLEDGRLTDNKGNTISFKNTIVICTSNIGSQLIVQKLGEKDKNIVRTEDQEKKDYVELSGQVNEELRKFFRPELLNRFDDIVIFKPLRRQDMKGIAKLGIKKTAKLLKEQGYGVQITDKALEQLAKEGYDPIYGARPLRRLIQTSIENPIALQIIGKTFTQSDVILIDYDAEKNAYKFIKSDKPAQDDKKDGEKTDDKDGKGAEETKVTQGTNADGSPADPNIPKDPNLPNGEANPQFQVNLPPADPNQPNQPPAPGGAAMGMPGQPPADPTAAVNAAVNAPAGMEALLGNAAAAPVEKPFDPLELVSSDSTTPSDPAVGENKPADPVSAPVTDNGAAPSTS
jgi:DNA polymerase III delta prime subunit